MSFNAFGYQTLLQNYVGIEVLKAVSWVEKQVYVLHLQGEKLSEARNQQKQTAS
jgi:hypothetical protein